MDEQDKELKANKEEEAAAGQQEQEQAGKPATPSDNETEEAHAVADEAAAQSGEAGVAHTTEPQTADEVCLPEHDVNKLTDVITQKNAIIEAYTARLVRLQADFENYRRRTQKEKEELATVVTENVLRDFLPVLDNFQRALETKGDTAASSLATGVSMIYRQMMGIMEKHGVSVIKAEGEIFDPKLHEAVMRVSDADKPDGLIIEELQRGYQYRGATIRPSMVKVVVNN